VLALAKLMFIIDRRSMRLWNLNPYPAKIHSFASRQVVEWKFEVQRNPGKFGSWQFRVPKFSQDFRKYEVSGVSQTQKKAARLTHRAALTVQIL
jgi:hypothetical protein